MQSIEAMSAIHPPAARDQALDLLKWLALLSMVLDHLRYVGWSLDILYVPGRMAFAWFCLAIAANVARQRAPVLRWRYLAWLSGFSLLAEWPYSLFVGPNEPWNVMPTLAMGLVVACGWRARTPLALGLALVVLVLAALLWDHLMFGLPGVLLPLACLVVLNRSPAWAMLPGVLCLWGNEWQVIVPAALAHNPVALAGIFACLLAPWLGMALLHNARGVKVPPAGRSFYAIYPLHFLLLLALRSIN